MFTKTYASMFRSMCEGVYQFKCEKSWDDYIAGVVSQVFEYVIYVTLESIAKYIEKSYLPGDDVPE